MKNELNNLNQYNYKDVKLSIDTMHIVARLDEEQYQFVNERFQFRINKVSKYHKEESKFHYIVNMKDITILASPKAPFANVHYNIMIIFKKRTSYIYMPYSIKEILQFENWQIHRIDLAFDFKTPFLERFILPHHGNVKFDDLSKRNDIHTDYLHPLKSDTGTHIASYDKNKKEYDKNTGIEHEFPTRYEVRLEPTLNEFNYLSNVDHGWIMKQLSKYIFVSDINLLPLDGWTKNRLRKIQQTYDYDYFKGLKRKERDSLKGKIKANRKPLELIYNLHKNDLFSFLDIEPLHIDLEEEHGEILDRLEPSNIIDDIEPVPDYIQDIYNNFEIETPTI